jgi:hypothetical protein
LAVFGRRPPQRVVRSSLPAAENLHRTARGRRVADLYIAFMEALGDPASTLIQANVIAAAELRVACEDARKRMFDSGSADADQLVRLENLAHRAERKLGLERRARQPAVPTLAEYLDHKHRDVDGTAA